MSAETWRDDEARTLVGEVVNVAAKIRRPRQAVGEVIDLHTLTPRQQRVAEFVGKCIGIGACYLIAGAIWTGRGMTWAVRFGLAAVRPKEAR
jgi:hypothetical protein